MSEFQFAVGVMAPIVNPPTFTDDELDDFRDACDEHGIGCNYDGTLVYAITYLETNISSTTRQTTRS